MKRLLIAFVVLVASSSAAIAGPGMNLNWDDCSVNGSRYKLFSCNTNTGSHTLVASFRAPDGITRFAGTEMELMVWSQTALPDWWRLRNQTGQINQCRSASLGVNADFAAGPNSCTDPYQGQFLSGIGSYTVGYNGNPNIARLVFLCALTAGYEIPLNQNQEYYAAKVVINNAKTVGATACAGCDVPAAIELLSVTIVQPAGVGDVVLNTPADRSFVGWQGDCQLFCECGFGPCACFLSCPTPAKSPTWGRVKSLYR